MADKTGAIPKSKKNTEQGEDNHPGIVDDVVADDAVNPTVENPVEARRPQTSSLNRKARQIKEDVENHLKALSPRDLIVLLDSMGLNSNGTQIEGADIDWDDELDLRTSDLPFTVAVWRKEASVDEMVDPSASSSRTENRSGSLDDQGTERNPGMGATFTSAANSLHWDSYGAPPATGHAGRRSVTWEDENRDQYQPQTLPSTSHEASPPTWSFNSTDPSARVNPFISMDHEIASERVAKQRQQLVRTGIKFGDKQDNAEEFLRELKEAFVSIGIAEHDALLVIPAVLQAPAKACTPDYSDQVWDEIQNRTQGPGEDLPGYITRMRILFSSLDFTIPEEHQLKMICKKLHPKYLAYAELVKTRTYLELLENAHSVEERIRCMSRYVPPPAERSIVPTTAFIPPAKYRRNTREVAVVDISEEINEEFANTQLNQEWVDDNNYQERFNRHMQPMRTPSGGPRPRQHFRNGPFPNQGQCFHCGQPGHYINVCPYRQQVKALPEPTQDQGNEKRGQPEKRLPP
ncbi:hypothetical protein PV326_014082, partial [Microctonus aethiopoides]